MISKPYLIKQKIFFDKRGYFQESVLKKKVKLSTLFTAIAKSKKNVIRGLHFQKKKKQTKIIHVIEGKILDVVINLKKRSKNFGKIYKFKLKKGDILFVPNFFAHGYECLSKKSIILYHLDNYRDVKNEDGIRFDDKQLNIKWVTKTPILSKRDKNSNSFEYFIKKIKTL